MIPVSDIYDPSLEGINNTIVYAKGKIDARIITRVLEIDLYNETELSETRRHIYEIERRGTQQKTSGIFRRHDPSDIGYIQWVERSRAQSQRHNDILGADGRTGTGKVETTYKRVQNPYLPIVHTFFIQDDSYQNENFTVKPCIPSNDASSCGDMMHLLRKNDVAPLRFAMMRCLPQCAVRHTSFA